MNEISFSGRYTFSKAIDDPFDFNEQPKNPYSLHAERALSSNDQRDRFVFSRTLDLPFGDDLDRKESAGMIDKLFGNVEAAPILTNWKRQADQSLTGFDANQWRISVVSSSPRFWPQLPRYNRSGAI